VTRSAGLALVSLLMVLAGCRTALPPGKPLSQLSPQEIAGHTVFQQQCARCHNAYDPSGLHGPGLLGVFRRPYLPSGSPAHDDRVTAVILHGRGMMPPFGSDLDQQQMQALLAYLHTL
jgi:mono/diheme cytochrome c family protein